MPNSGTRHRLYTILKDRKILRHLRRGWLPKQIHFTYGYSLGEIYKAMERSRPERREAERASTEDRRKIETVGRNSAN